MVTEATKEVMNRRIIRIEVKSCRECLYAKYKCPSCSSVLRCEYPTIQPPMVITDKAIVGKWCPLPTLDSTIDMC